MTKTNVKRIKKQDVKRKDIIQKTNMYKDTAVNAMKNVLEFDSMAIKSNDEYLAALLLADKSEYDILKANMEKAETAEERQAIRSRMAEMKKERYIKDTENKVFYEKQQTSYKNYTLQILCSIAAVTGLAVKFKKPLMDAGKKLITKQ